MNHRERVLRTFRFEPTDRPPYDLMEGCVWPELLDDFRARRGLPDALSVLDFLGADFRWAFVRYEGPPAPPASAPAQAAYSKPVAGGPLAGARSVRDVLTYSWPDPAWWLPADYAAFAAQYPDHARVLCVGWAPLFWSACEAFGMEEALVKMAVEPDLFCAFVQRQDEFYTDILHRCLDAAEGHCDICWLGDDYATQRAMVMSPVLWRRHIKPRLAGQVRLAREHGMAVLFHSCGSVRAILPDLIDIGVSGLLVFQTTAAGMDAPSIARDFGGRMVFYGGVDVQHLLCEGSPEQVAREVRANIEAFRQCGGYVAANSHHSMAAIKGENIEAMCRAAVTYPMSP